MGLSALARRTLHAAARAAAHLLPPRCVLCATPGCASALCDACRAELPGTAVPRCPVCAIQMPLEERCGQCMASPPAFVRAVTVASYAFPLDAVIRRFKYAPDLALATPLSNLLAQRVAAEPRPDLVIPMPLSAPRLRARGFNQAVELARRVAGALDLPLALDLCTRVRETLPQADLPWDERAANVRGAFACQAVPARARIAVVDDVMTTGATLEELARTVRRSGALEVVAWVVARTERP